jgi:hypothetical protein
MRTRTIHTRTDKGTSDRATDEPGRAGNEGLHVGEQMADSRPAMAERPHPKIVPYAMRAPFPSFGGS